MAKEAGNVLNQIRYHRELADRFFIENRTLSVLSIAVKRPTSGIEDKDIQAYRFFLRTAYVDYDLTLRRNLDIVSFRRYFEGIMRYMYSETSDALRGDEEAKETVDKIVHEAGFTDIRSLRRVTGFVLHSYHADLAQR